MVVARVELNTNRVAIPGTAKPNCQTVPYALPVLQALLPTVAAGARGFHAEAQRFGGLLYGRCRPVTKRF